MNKAEKIGLFLFAGLLTLMTFGFFRNGVETSFALYERNRLYADFSKNDYPERYIGEFLDSLEKDSVLITEGRDTEVFTLLYYALVEGRRADVDIFDQQGNVFPRLYGDMYHPPIDHQWVKDLRNFEMFSMDKSVYLNWRKDDIGRLSLPYLQEKKKELKDFFEKRPDLAQSAASPGFNINDRASLEYTLTNMVDKRIFNPVFRNGESFASRRLRDEGPWYLKQYGLLYKALNVRYALLDVMQVFREIDLPRLRDGVELTTHLRISDDALKSYLSRFEKEGYVSREGAVYRFKKNIPPANENYPNQEAYEKLIDRSYLKVPNAPYWDYLTRDIFIRKAVVLSGYHAMQFRLAEMAKDYWSQRDPKRVPFYEDFMDKEKNFVVSRLKEISPYLDGAGLNMEIFSLLDDVKAQKAMIEMILGLRKDHDNRYELDYRLAEAYRKLAENEDDKEYYSKSLDYYHSALDKLGRYAKQRKTRIEEMENYRIINLMLKQAESEKEYSKAFVEGLKKSATREEKTQDMKLLAEIYFQRQNYEEAAKLYARIFVKGSKNDRLLVWRRWQQSANGVNKADGIVFAMKAILDSDIEKDIVEAPSIFGNLIEILLYWGDKEKEKGRLGEARKRYLDAQRYVKKYENDNKFKFFVEKYETMIAGRLGE